jgi:hypothetical protein
VTENQPDEKVLETVRRLVALANDEGTTQAERDAAFARADRLMTQHAISEAMVRAARGREEREQPSVKAAYRLWDAGTEFDTQWSTLVSSLARHNRVRALHHSMRPGTYTLVGFPDDISYFEIIWTGAYLTFAAKMTPVWNASETEQENVYRLKEAGVKWRKIAEMGEFQWPDGGLLIRMYKRQCKALGVPATPQTQRHAAYRNSYAEAFVSQISYRIRLQTEVRAGQVKDTPGAELALRDRSADVAEKVYELFPELRPPSAEEYAKLVAETEALSARILAREEARRAALTQKERDAEDRQAAKANARYDRDWERNQRARHDSQGARAGRAAADQVDLSGGRNSVGATRHPELG